jgi:thiol-disulfide isomerase/thioredoxin
MFELWSGVLLAASIALAQQPAVSTFPTGAPAQQTADAEEQELAAALQDANNSTVDLVRVLEAFLLKHPETMRRNEIDRVLAKAAIDNHDDPRTALYGERVLAITSDDIPVLDRVPYSLLALGGRENAAKARGYAQALEKIITGMPPPAGNAAAQRQEERDRALSRALLYESRADTTLGDHAAAERLAAKAFATYPSEQAAHEWSDVLGRLGRDEDALTHLADAFAIVDPHSTDPDHSADRRSLAELYRKVHGSEQGLGDLILAAYDRTSTLVEERRKRLKALDSNFLVTEPMQLTLTGLDGNKLALPSLKGKVLVLDFWATWCVPCRAQHPMYETVKQRFKDRTDVVFLAIDTDEDRQSVAPFLDSQNWSHTVYFEDGLQRLMQVTSIPTTVLFDKRGKIWSRMDGFLPDRFVDQLTDRIQSALKESATP